MSASTFSLETGAQPLVWVVTGASSGLGKAIALEVMSRSSPRSQTVEETNVAISPSPAIVYALGRHAEPLKPLAQAGCRVVTLDLAGSVENIGRAIADIEAETGRIDVLINAAGYLLEGGVEETSESEIQHLLSTNLLGPLRLARAVLPTMRGRGRGVIVNVCGIATYRGSPNAGLYCASKAALSSLTESLQAETEPLGIRVCLAQLGHFRTSFLHTSSDNSSCNSCSHRQRIADPIEDYEPVLAPLRKAFNGLNDAQPGDPARAARVIVQLAGGRDNEGNSLIPRFLPLGSDVVPAMVSAHEERLKEADTWKEVSRSVDLSV